MFLREVPLLVQCSAFYFPFLVLLHHSRRELNKYIKFSGKRPMDFFFSKKLQPYRSESITGFSLVILHNFFRKAIHSLEHLRTVVKIRHKQFYPAETLKLVMKTCSIYVKKNFLSSMFISNVKLVVTLFLEKSGNLDWF